MRQSHTCHLFSLIFNFNPRTREGCDADDYAPVAIPKVISIHAPVKGATRCLYALARQASDFNPRTREGCDISASGRRSCSSYFNPRTREGCDLRRGPPAGRSSGNFNPRTREGCDNMSVDFYNLAQGISIHAPVKGATVALAVTTALPDLFQSTHP